MDKTILVIEDNSSLLELLQTLLENNNYKVIMALNGKEALDKLQRFDSNLPDLIISDISMPEMDGYQFFKEISNKPFLGHIPFIFLTGLSKPENVRLGKLLGVDDYITKPFDEKDLLASIEGKLKRYNLSNKVNANLKNLIKSAEFDIRTPNSGKDEEIVLFAMSWNNKIGPNLLDYYPKKQINNKNLEDLTFQFFQAFKAISGGRDLDEPQGILVNIENIRKKGYFYFFSIDNRNKNVSKLFLLGVLASQINYLHSLKLKKIFNSLSKLYPAKKKPVLRENFAEIQKVLSESPF
jgi:CheY-like chemotaxis protein